MTDALLIIVVSVMSFALGWHLGRGYVYRKWLKLVQSSKVREGVARD